MKKEGVLMNKLGALRKNFRLFVIVSLLIFSIFVILVFSGLGDVEEDVVIGERAVVDGNVRSLVGRVDEGSIEDAIKKDIKQKFMLGANFNSLEVIKREERYNIYYDTILKKNLIEIYPSPVNYLEGYEYKPINTTITSENCDYDYCVREGIYYADFKVSSNSKNLVKFLYNDSYITYTPSDLRYIRGNDEEVIYRPKNLEGYAEGDKFVYENFYDQGIDLEYKYNKIFLKESLIIEDKLTLPKPSFESEDTYLAMDFVINTKSVDKKSSELRDNDIIFSGKVNKEDKENLKWDKSEKVNVRGRAYFKKDNGDISFQLPVPYAIDSEGNQIELEYVFEKKGNDLVVSVLTPYSWLKDASYPIKIDPTTATMYGIGQGRAHLLNKTDYEGYDFVSNALSAGLDYLGGNNYSVYRSYVEWNPSSSIRNELWGQQYDSVNLQFYVENMDDESKPVYFHAIDEDYPSDLTPSTFNDMRDLFNKINDYSSGNNITEDYYIGWIVPNYTNPITPTNIGLNPRDFIANFINNSENLIIGFSGSESLSDSIADIYEVGDYFEPRLSITYTCTQASGCQSCLDLANGVSCDCWQECSNDWCWGDSVDNYDCSSDCATDGKYAPTSSECCNVWNPISKECYSCTIPDGNSVECECDFDSDCPEGYYCEKVPGLDACVSNLMCNGTIAPFVQDSSGNPIEDAYVYLNNVSQGQTDQDGLKELTVNNVACGTFKEIKIKCSDDTTICGINNVAVDNVTGSDYDSPLFTCDLCLSKVDLFVNKEDISFEEQSGQTNVSVVVHSVNVEASNVKISFSKICNGDYTITDKTIPTVTSSNNYNVSILDDLSECSKIRVHIDSDNQVSEDEEGNNEVFRFVSAPAKVYLSVDTGYQKVDDEIRNYIGEEVQLVSQGDAQIELYVGRRAVGNLEVIDGWGMKDKLISYNGLQEGFPYNGVIGVREVSGKPSVYVFGNDIDGTIASVRSLVDNKNIWLYTDILDITPEAVYLSKEDVDALYVFDYLHTSENKNKYRTNTNEFAGDVRRVLNAETYSIAIKRVLTANEDNVSLRLKHLNQELSSEFQSFNNPRPVVLGHGLFGNLFSMESLGKKIAVDKSSEEGTWNPFKKNKREIRDVWLMEYSGGPNTECDSCPNYDYDDLIDWYWPALMGGVLKYSGENSTDYIGYSAGGGVGIRSYEKYYLGNSSTMGYYVNDSGSWEGFSLPANFVDHMALIAPMGAFDGESAFTVCMDEYGDELLDRLSPLDHFDRRKIAKELTLITKEDSILDSKGRNVYCGSISRAIDYFGGETGNISYNFWQDITNDVQNKTDTNPKLSSVNESLLVRAGLQFTTDDGIIPKEDIDYMYSNSNTTEKYKARSYHWHGKLQNKDDIYDPLVSKFLNDKPYTTTEEWRYWIESD